MRNFDTELDRLGVTRLVAVTETVEITPTPTPVQPRVRSMAFIGKADVDWQWDDLRDYVISEIEKKSGPIVRKPATQEYGIFNSFLKRWGLRAPAIARYAFETCGGVWRNSQVRVESFCKNADPHFAQPISDRLI